MGWMPQPKDKDWLNRYKNKTFMFKVIIDKYDPVAIYFIVLGLSLYTPFVFPV